MTARIASDAFSGERLKKSFSSAPRKWPSIQPNTHPEICRISACLSPNNNRLKNGKQFGDAAGSILLSIAYVSRSLRCRGTVL
jgi:hypothetical protein